MKSYELITNAYDNEAVTRNDLPNIYALFGLS